MSNIVWHEHSVSKKERALMKNQKPRVIWLTGLSGSGKSTIANELDLSLSKMGMHTYLLDGDNVRHGLCSNLGFSPEDREENIRRVAETCKLMVDAGLIVLACFISPYEKDRQFARSLVEADEFIEVFVDCDLETCEARDPKGLYKKVRSGEIKSFTGIDSPYEKPKKPEISINSATISPSEAVQIILDRLKS